MTYKEPTGYVECDNCGMDEVVDMEAIADGDGGYDAYLYSYLPGDWLNLNGMHLCGRCRGEYERKELENETSEESTGSG